MASDSVMRRIRSMAASVNPVFEFHGLFMREIVARYSELEARHVSALFSKIFLGADK